MPAREERVAGPSRRDLDDLWTVVHTLRDGAAGAAQSGVLEELDKLRQEVRELGRQVRDSELPLDEVASLLERVKEIEGRSGSGDGGGAALSALEARLRALEAGSGVASSPPEPVEGITDDELAALPQDTRLGLKDLIKLATKHGFSDFFLKPGAPPQAFLKGRLTSIGRAPISANDSRRIVLPALTYETRRRLYTEKWVGDWSLQGDIRFRLEVSLQGDGVCATFQRTDCRPPDPEATPLPAEVPGLLHSVDSGIILLVGGRRCGKSTTLGSLIGKLNQERKLRISTLERPLAFTHLDQKAWICQREVGRDVPSFKAGLQLALEEAPEVLAVDGLRLSDSEAMFGALQCAATALVLLTLQVDNENLAFEFLVGAQPADRQFLARAILKHCLRGVIRHRLVDVGEKGRVPELTVVGPDFRLLSGGGEPAPAPAPVAGPQTSPAPDPDTSPVTDAAPSPAACEAAPALTAEAANPPAEPPPEPPTPEVDDTGALMDFL